MVGDREWILRRGEEDRSVRSSASRTAEIEAEVRDMLDKLEIVVEAQMEGGESQNPDKFEKCRSNDLPGFTRSIWFVLHANRPQVHTTVAVNKLNATSPSLSSHAITSIDAVAPLGSSFGAALFG